MHLIIIQSTLNHLYWIMAVIMPFIDTKPIHSHKYKQLNRHGLWYGSVARKQQPKCDQYAIFIVSPHNNFSLTHTCLQEQEKFLQALKSQLFPKTQMEIPTRLFPKRKRKHLYNDQRPYLKLKHKCLKLFWLNVTTQNQVS